MVDSLGSRVMMGRVKKDLNELAKWQLKWSTNTEWRNAQAKEGKCGHFKGTLPALAGG